MEKESTLRLKVEKLFQCKHRRLVGVVFTALLLICSNANAFEIPTGNEDFTPARGQHF
jgi:hypothetical protein